MNLVMLLSLLVCFDDIYIVTQKEFQAHGTAQWTTRPVQGPRSLSPRLEPGKVCGKRHSLESPSENWIPSSSTCSMLSCSNMNWMAHWKAGHLRRVSLPKDYLQKLGYRSTTRQGSVKRGLPQKSCCQAQVWKEGQEQVPSCGRSPVAPSPGEKSAQGISQRGHQENIPLLPAKAS